MKRPILGFLAAVILSVGLLGSAPARAASSDATTAMVTPAHSHDRDDGYKYSHHDGYGHRSRHHYRHHHDYDGDGDDHDHDGRRPCRGLIVICLG